MLARKTSSLAYKSERVSPHRHGNLCPRFDRQRAGHGYKEVTSHDRFRSPNERGPSLIGTSVWTFSTQVFLTVRGETRTPSLSFSSLAIRSLAPGRIVVGHLANQFARVLWQLRSASLSRLPSPERPERGAMPFKECLRLDNDQSITPMKEPGEQDHERACGSGRTSSLLHPFLKQSELFAKEQGNQQEQATF